MVFDWTISLGNILTVGGFGFSGVVFVLMMRGDMLVLGTRIRAIEDALKEMAKAQLVMAETEGRVRAMDERITMISQRLDRFINRSQ